MGDFSTKLRESREAKGLSQIDLAMAIGISVRSVSAYETGKSYPRGNIANKLAKVLGVSIDHLLADEENCLANGEIIRFEGVDKAQMREINELARRNISLLNDRSVRQEIKDAFFLTVTKAYWQTKEMPGNGGGRNWR